jgi:hypothetical protein
MSVDDLVQKHMCDHRRLVEDDGAKDTNFHQPSPNTYFRCVPFMFWENARVLTAPRVAVVPLDFVTQVKVCLVREADSNLL